MRLRPRWQRLAKFVAHKAAPVGREFTAQLRDPAGRNFELAGGLTSLIAQRKILGDAAMANGERLQPSVEVDAACGNDAAGVQSTVESGSPARPSSFLSNLIEAFDDDVLLLAVAAQNILDVQVPADLSVVAGLLDSIAGQGDRVGDVGLAKFDKSGVGLAGIGNDFLNSLGTSFGLEKTERTLRMRENLWQHAEEGFVPVRTRIGGRRGNHGTEPPRDAGGATAPARSGHVGT